MADTKLRVTKDDRGDAQTFNHECPACGSLHRHTPSVDGPILTGERTFRCYFGNCGRRGTVLQIVHGYAIDVSGFLVFDSRRRKSTEPSTPIQRKAEEIVSEAMRGYKVSRFGYDDEDEQKGEMAVLPPPKPEPGPEAAPPPAAAPPRSWFEGMGPFPGMWAP